MVCYGDWPDGSAAVAHPGVLHPQDRRLLVLLERGVDDLTDEQAVRPDVHGRVQLAIGVGDRLIEDRRAGYAVVEREPVQGACLEIDIDRLRELADDRPVLTIDDAQGERTALGDELVRDGLLLDADAEQLRIEAQLRDPVARHAVASLAGAAADDEETGRHRPEDTPPQPVIRFGVGAGGERTNRSGAEWHSARLSGSSMTDYAQAYGTLRSRVSDLVRTADPEQLERLAPAAPEWRVRDLVAHLSGITADVNAGNLDGVATDAWTARQVDTRRDWSIEQLLEEWDTEAAKVEAVMASLPEVAVGQMTADAATHEQDIRGGLERPGARDCDAVVIGCDWGVQILAGVADPADATLHIETESGTTTVGTGT